MFKIVSLVIVFILLILSNIHFYNEYDSYKSAYSYCHSEKINYESQIKKIRNELIDLKQRDLPYYKENNQRLEEKVRKQKKEINKLELELMQHGVFKLK